MPVTSSTATDLAAPTAAPSAPAGAAAGGAAAFQAALDGAAVPGQQPATGQATEPTQSGEPSAAAGVVTGPPAAPLPDLALPQQSRADGTPAAFGKAAAAGSTARRPAGRPAEQAETEQHALDTAALAAALGTAPLPQAGADDRQQHHEDAVAADLAGAAQPGQVQAGQVQALPGGRPPSTAGPLAPGASGARGVAAPSGAGPSALTGPTAVGGVMASPQGATQPGAGTRDGAADRRPAVLAAAAAAQADATGALQPQLAPPAAPAAPVTAPAPASATPGAGAPADPPLADQLTPPIAALRTAATGQHVITVRVTPENLGPVTVHAHVSDGGLRVELFAPTAEARGALSAMLPDLRRELAATGSPAASPGATSVDVGTGDAPRDGGRGAFPGAPFGDRDGSGRGAPRWDAPRPAAPGDDRPHPFVDRPRRAMSAVLDVLA